jgi:uncharacterized membrane protein YesL
MCCFAQIQPLSNNNNLSLPFCRHKNGFVRATAVRLLTVIVTTSDADAVLTPAANQIYKERFLSAAAIFLEDANVDARYYICFNYCELIWRQQSTKKMLLDFQYFILRFILDSLPPQL